MRACHCPYSALALPLLGVLAAHNCMAAKREDEEGAVPLTEDELNERQRKLLRDLDDEEEAERKGRTVVPTAKRFRIKRKVWLLLAAIVVLALYLMPREHHSGSAGDDDDDDDANDDLVDAEIWRRNHARDSLLASQQSSGQRELEEESRARETTWPAGGKTILLLTVTNSAYQEWQMKTSYYSLRKYNPTLRIVTLMAMQLAETETFARNDPPCPNPAECPMVRAFVTDWLTD